MEHEALLMHDLLTALREMVEHEALDTRVHVLRARALVQHVITQLDQLLVLLVLVEVVAQDMHHVLLLHTHHELILVEIDLRMHHALVDIKVGHLVDTREVTTEDLVQVLEEVAVVHHALAEDEEEIEGATSASIQTVTSTKR